MIYSKVCALKKTENSYEKCGLKEGKLVFYPLVKLVHVLFDLKFYSDADQTGIDGKILMRWFFK